MGRERVAVGCARVAAGLLGRCRRARAVATATIRYGYVSSFVPPRVREGAKRAMPPIAIVYRTAARHVLQRSPLQACSALLQEKEGGEASQW